MSSEIGPYDANGEVVTKKSVDTIRTMEEQCRSGGGWVEMRGLAFKISTRRMFEIVILVSHIYSQSISHYLRPRRPLSSPRNLSR